MTPEQETDLQWMDIVKRDLLISPIHRPSRRAIERLVEMVESAWAEIEALRKVVDAADKAVMNCCFTDLESEKFMTKLAETIAELAEVKESKDANA